MFKYRAFEVVPREAPSALITTLSGGCHGKSKHVSTQAKIFTYIAVLLHPGQAEKIIFIKHARHDDGGKSILKWGFQTKKKIAQRAAALPFIIHIRTYNALTWSFRLQQ